MKDIKEYCRVCGLYLGYNPYGEDNNSPDYSICACCGVEAGNEDYKPKWTLEYRIKWIKQRFYWKLGEKRTIYDKKFLMWFDEKKKPENWNPIDQLKNIGIDFSDEETIKEYKKEIPNIEEIIGEWIK